MRTKTGKLLKTTFFSLSIIFFLMAGLSIYMYSTRHAGYGSLSNLQMSRIDFKEPVDSILSSKIKGTIAKQAGVDHVYFNEVDDIVVYSHDPKKQSAQQVFETVQSTFPIAMERYIVTSEMEQASCPVTGKNSFMVKMGGFFWRLFNQSA